MANALERFLGMAPTKPNRSEDALADIEAPRAQQAEEDDTPEHLQLQNVLDRMERILSRDINHYASLQEEYGIYDANSSDHTCKVPQPINAPVYLNTVMASFDTGITSWVLTLGRRVITFNSTGTDGSKVWTDLHIPLRPGDERSLKPVTGTPSTTTTLYLCGELVRMN